MALVNELADFLKNYEGQLMELAAIPLREMSLEQRKTAQRWVGAVVERGDLRETETT